MADFTEYPDYDGLGLAALVRRGEVSASELLDAAIARTEALNGDLNAVVLKHYDEARAAIAAGLPRTIRRWLRWGASCMKTGPSWRAFYAMPGKAISPSVSRRRPSMPRPSAPQL